jgi:hypothetical protein
LGTPAIGQVQKRLAALKSSKQSQLDCDVMPHRNAMRPDNSRKGFPAERARNNTMEEESSFTQQHFS